MKASIKWLLSVTAVSLLACGGGRMPPGNDPFATFDPLASATGNIPDFRPIYNQMGLVAAPLPIAFVANSAFFASDSPDSTTVVATISIPNRGLTFERDGDEYKATYAVTITVSTSAGNVVSRSSRETVRVGTHKEVGRTDESIIFQESFKVQPGSYALSYGIEDIVGGASAAEQEIIHVPAFSNRNSISRPVVIYDAEQRKGFGDVPDYLASPRASFEFGVDSVIGVYIEAYNSQSGATASPGDNIPVVLILRDSGKAPAWIDTISLVSQGGVASGVIDIPMAAADVGIWNLVARRLDSQDSSRASVFVGFGPDLPVLSFRDMIGYLRYFAPNSEIQKLYKASPEERGEVWTNFLRITDRSPATPQNEALQAYFTRIRIANYQFRGDIMAGWLSPRGSVYVGLGEPSAIYQEEGYLPQYSIMSSGQKVRVLIWEYQELQASIIFIDELWSGQWKMLQSSESQFRSLLARVVSIR